MNASSLRLSAMNILAIREHSIRELKTKLEKKFPADNDKIALLLSQLVADDLLSNERFVEVFIRSRINKGFGPVKIRYELGLKGIEKDVIKSHLDRCDDQWFECMQKVWNKRFTSTDNNNKETNKLKQSRYLYQRGFSYDQINKFLDSMKSPL